MKFSEVKRLFVLEFARIPMDGYERRNTWLTFVNDLFEGGAINARVYAHCNAIAI